MSQFTREFSARHGDFEAIVRLLERFSEHAGVAPDTALKLRLVMEELFTNTIRHGYGHESSAPVWVALERVGSEVCLTYEDAAPPFNPFAAGEPPDLLATARTRSTGGLGVLLAASITRQVSYSYVAGRNRTALWLPCGDA